MSKHKADIFVFEPTEQICYLKYGKGLLTAGSFIFKIFIICICLILVYSNFAFGQNSEIKPNEGTLLFSFFLVFLGNYYFSDSFLYSNTLYRIIGLYLITAGIAGISWYVKFNNTLREGAVNLGVQVSF